MLLIESVFKWSTIHVPGARVLLQQAVFSADEDVAHTIGPVAAISNRLQKQHKASESLV